MRDATEKDLPAIVEIYNSTIPGRMATADLEPVTVESRLPWLRAHDPARRPLWVEERGGRVVGWISLQDFYGRPAYAATAEVSVYVDARERGRGHGARLLAAIAQRAPGFGVSTLLGFIFAHNAPSLALFERAGFARWGLLPRVAVLDGVPRDLAIVGRRIPSG
jgi:phosphinothricin acetyltransferase